jgi:hypothetical protein
MLDVMAKIYISYRKEYKLLNVLRIMKTRKHDEKTEENIVKLHVLYNVHTDQN